MYKLLNVVFVVEVPEEKTLEEVLAATNGILIPGTTIVDVRVEETDPEP